MSIEKLTAEVAMLRSAVEAIKKATLDGRVCDDVAWFDDLTTLHDFCDFVLEDGVVMNVCVLAKPRRYLVTPTAVLRRHAKPVFLPPHQWPTEIWSSCVGMHRYWPSYTHQGDCNICGHDQHSPRHVR